MKAWLLIPTTVASLFLTTTPQNWTPFLSREGGFVVTMPDTPKETTTTVNTVHGPVALHRFLVEPSSSSTAYLVTYTQLSPIAAHRPVDVTLNAAASRLPRGIHGRLVSCRPCKLQGFPGRDLTVTNDEGVLSLARIFVANGRFYQVVVLAPSGRVDRADTDKFMGSFRILTRR